MTYGIKRKTEKKLVTLVLAAIIAVGSIGCGSNEKENGRDEKRETVSIMTISFNGPDANTGEYAEEIINRIEDYCDCNLEIEFVNNDSMSEKADMVLQSPESMPMIMTWGGAVTADVVSAARNGLFVNLSDYIWDSEKYPNLSGMLPSVAGSLTVDGQQIAIPRTRVVARYGLCYRTDWAERLNLAEPSTPEAVYDMLYAFTYNDPDGNGIDDTVGLEMTGYTGVFDIIQTWFGCGNGWAEVDGKLIPVHLQDEYIDALQYIKKLYDDGLMAPDWAARPSDTWSSGCKSGKNGVFIDVMDSGRRIWDYFVSDSVKTPSVVDSNELASMTLYGAVNGRTLATMGYNGFFTLSVSTCNTPEKIEAALRLLDRLCDDEMLILTQYGIEGVHYKVEDGYIVRLDDGNKELTNNYAGLNQMLAYLPSAEHVTTPHVKNSERMEAQNEAYAKALPCAVVNPATVYLINSTAYAEVGVSLQNMIDQARTKYICGEITLSELLEVNATWLSQGGSRIIDEVNKQFEANKH